jgi:hypothetical protein
MCLWASQILTSRGFCMIIMKLNSCC